MQEDKDEKEKKRHPLANIALVSQLAISIVSPILVGLFIGGYLDDKFKKDGLFTVILLFIGAGSGIMNLFKLAYPKNKEK